MNSELPPGPSDLVPRGPESLASTHLIRRGLSLANSLASLQVSSDLYFNRGVEALEVHRYQEAVEDFEQALRIKPDHFLAYYHMGRGLCELMRFQEGLEAFRKTIQINPSYEWGLYGLGYVLCKLGRLDESLEAFREMARNHPEDYLGHLGSGYVLNRLGKHQEASQSCERATRINSADHFAWFTLGSAYFQMARYSMALGTLKEVLRLKPGHSQAKRMIEEILKTSPKLEAVGTSAYLKTEDTEPNLEVIEAVQEAGLSYFKEGITDPEKWRAAVLKDFADFVDMVEPHLGLIYDMAKDAFIEEGGTISEEPGHKPEEPTGGGLAINTSLNESELREKADSLLMALGEPQPQPTEDSLLMLILVVSEMAPRESDLANQAETWEEFQSLHYNTAGQLVRIVVSDELHPVPIPDSVAHLHRWAERIVMDILDRLNLP